MFKNKALLKEERHQKILASVALHNRVLLTDIASELNVSIDTIRRDVKELDKIKRLKKVHGGAVSLSFVSHNPITDVYALEEKQRIASKAVQLLKEDSVILIDGGTTCMELVRKIAPKMQLTCFTLSLPVAIEMMNKPNVNVIFIGGEIFKDAQMATGSSAINNLSQVRFDYSFIGTGYVDPQNGLTEFDWNIVQLKKAIIEASKKTVLLTLSEKFHSQQRYKTTDIKSIHTMITELDPTDKKLDPFRKLDINLL